MRILLLAAWLLLLAGGAGHAQPAQVLCQRGLGTFPYAAPYSWLQPLALLATAPDSCLLYARDDAANSPLSAQARSRLRWVGGAQCDTAGFATLYTGTNNTYLPARLVRRRRGDLLVSTTIVRQSPADSNRILLCSYSRRGALRWRHLYPAGWHVASDRQSEQVDDLLEAPDRGAYLASSADTGYLTKVDSLGRLEWKRGYCQRPNEFFVFGDLAYTRRGNLLLMGRRSLPGSSSYVVMEVSQRGDSLTSRLAFDLPGRSPQLVSGRALRDGGFLLLGSVDTLIAPATVPTRMPVLARLDADLHRQWQRTVPALRRFNGYNLGQGGLELADGSLLVALALSNDLNVHLMHFSAAGALRQDFVYQSQYPSGSLSLLTPLAADSSFVLVSDPRNTYSAYLDHFRLPGLRRVLAEPGIPPAQVLATLAPAAARPSLAAYPNPASTVLHVPTALLAAHLPAELCVYDATGRLVLRQPVASPGSEVLVDVQGWAAGLYQLVLRRGGQVVGTQRLAIQP